ncbi:MAG: AAA family ATPase, partial [Bacteroidaceae bacterium]|nr:AAA family ATPase [Bacteroidaceae bacterium]
YDEGGQLTEAVRRKPYSVILLDEIEKAHPDVFNVLLQVLDDGRLTDNKGRTVNFKNTIIIMTSNLGSDYIREKSAQIGTTDAQRQEWLEETRKHLLEMLKQTIRPEFLNRIDETVVFMPLKESEIHQIVALQVNSVCRMLKENGITLNVDASAVELISKAGYDPEFGARPVKRAIQTLLLNRLSTMILSGQVDRNKPVTATARNGEIEFN